MAAPDHPLTVSWVLFGFRGRIGRKSFILGALLLVLVQAALVAYATRFGDADTAIGQVRVTGADAFLVGLLLLGSWFASAWALLAMAVKRLHDLDLPAPLAICLIIPAIAFFAWLFLAAMPSRQVTNRHGPPPFPETEP